MKTLTDLFNLIAKETEISRDKMVKFTFSIDTNFNWLSFVKIYPVFSETESEIKEGIEMAKKEKDEKEYILRNLDISTTEGIQQAYWTIYNQGRLKDNKQN